MFRDSCPATRSLDLPRRGTSNHRELCSTIHERSGESCIRPAIFSPGPRNALSVENENKFESMKTVSETRFAVRGRIPASQPRGAKWRDLLVPLKYRRHFLRLATHRCTNASIIYKLELPPFADTSEDGERAEEGQRRPQAATSRNFPPRRAFYNPQIFTIRTSDNRTRNVKSYLNQINANQ